MMFIKNKLLPLLYVAYLLIYLFCGVFNFAYDRAVIEEEINVPLSSIETENLKQLDENRYISVTNDPQIIINIDLDKVNPQTVKYMLSQGGTGEKAMYYSTNKQAQLSGKRCLLPSGKADKEVGYILPKNNINQVRLDISGTSGEIIMVQSITVNFKPTLAQYFNFSPVEIAKFLILPLLLGTVIRYCIDIYNFYIKRQR